MTKNSLFLLILLSILRCSAPTDPKLLEYVDSAESGINFSNTLIDNEAFNIVDYLYYYNGGGVAVGDIDNDGLEDIYFSANQGDNALYLNKGEMRFEEVTQSAGVASSGAWKTGVTMADVNADGFLDIYVCRVGKYKGIDGHNELYINNGDLTFTESAKQYGLDFQGFSTQAAFFDLDNDSDLDVYLLNHSVHTRRSYGRAELRFETDSLAGDRLYLNENGSYKDITNTSGIYTSQIGYGLGIGLSDFDQDGFTDIYISNDFHENDYLYLNNGNQTFTESIGKMIAHSSRSSMGNDVADINNDGLPEILTLDMLPEDETVLKNSAGEESYDIYKLKQSFGYEKQFARNMLQLNNGDGTFSEIGLMSGVAATDWSWAPLLVDLDMDGLRDLFVSNGIVKRPNDMDYIMFLSANNRQGNPEENSEIQDSTLIALMPDGKVKNYFFRNMDGRHFTDVGEDWAELVPTYSTSSAYADFDNDGDPDLVINNINAPAQILRNNSTGKNYLKIKAVGPQGNPQGIGMKARVYTREHAQFSELFPDRGFQSSGSKELLFGLGDVMLIDSVRVIWPGGKTILMTDVAANQTLKMDYHSAKGKFDFVTKQETEPLLSEITGEVNLLFQHYENVFVDFNSQKLIPHVISREGPDIAVADVNGDELEDLYICGASGNNGMLYLQRSDGAFIKHSESTFRSTPAYEEVSSLFFDSDGDGDQDLYLVSAGNEHRPPKPTLNDRLLINDGTGVFTWKEDALQEDFQHGSVATAADIDHDGDLDLFIGGRVEPGKYGKTPESRILFNIGNNRFRNETENIAPELQRVGMVTDALWVDLNGDGWSDLMLVGEWMPITIFMNDEGKLSRLVSPDLEGTNGWWNVIEASDLDNDGDDDFVLGNLGSNSKLRPTREDPVRMYVNDFDQNFFLDQIVTYSVNGKEYPLANKDELGSQLPLVKKTYQSFRDFAGRTIREVFQPESLAASKRYDAYYFQTAVLMNLGDLKFQLNQLPEEAQISPIHAIAHFDLNADGFEDLIIGGNEEWTIPYFGAYDASYGATFFGDGQGNFEFVPAMNSGFKVQGDIRSIESFTSADGSACFAVGRNDDKAMIFKLSTSRGRPFE